VERTSSPPNTPQASFIVHAGKSRYTQYHTAFLVTSSPLHYDTPHAPCTFNPASTWIRMPVILVFFANMMNASTQSSRNTSCLSAAASLMDWMRSAGYFRPCVHVNMSSLTIHTPLVSQNLGSKGLRNGMEEGNGNRTGDNIPTPSITAPVAPY
jgi:hypothetical protein